MAEINFAENNMACFMICEAIGKEKDIFEECHMEGAIGDFKIVLNGIELDTKKFLNGLARSYNENVEKRAIELLRLRYDNILQKLYEIEETLERHNTSLEQQKKEEIDIMDLI